MGEFVGIDPRGAQELIRRLEAGKGVLGGTRPGLDAAIAEAGQDWTGRQGTTAMHRTWAFYHESQQDLRWRIDTLEQLVPVRERGMLTGTFPFGSEAEARRAAEETAGAIRAAEAGADGDGAAGDEVPDIEGKAGDPAYAAALLAALGPDAFTRALDGGLAAAFASAERTGRLGDEWYALVESAPPDVLTRLVTLAGQSGTFLNRVAVGLLNRPPDPGWSPHGLIAAYGRDPLAFQQLLAEHPRETRVLLAAAAADPEIEEALAGVLHEAMKPGAGADGLRERAWVNVVRGIDEIGAEIEGR